MTRLPGVEDQDLRSITQEIMADSAVGQEAIFNVEQIRDLWLWWHPNVRRALEQVLLAQVRTLHDG